MSERSFARLQKPNDLLRGFKEEMAGVLSVLPDWGATRLKTSEFASAIIENM